MEKCNFKYCNNMAFLSSSLQIREAAGIADKMKPFLREADPNDLKSPIIEYEILAHFGILHIVNLLTNWHESKS